ncbi:MAG: NAD(P)/FAD-dependent oxidoreductase [Bryobacterales bacterium]|nr:NAD(P)/FAD-dependent oxidoreductase [Bryobacterales bacterium]
MTKNNEQRTRLAVIGNGMAGVACVEQILKYSRKFDITIFGEETHVNYNRIMLSSVLAGECSTDEITINDWDWYKANDIKLRAGVRITAIDPIEKTLTGEDGSVTPFDKLIIATGSKALMPPVDGIDKEGIFTFRNLDDTRALLERSRPGLKAVVIGGGLLGLEAARGLQVQGCQVTVVHRSPWLMSRQLDAVGGAYLVRKMETLGVRVLTSAQTRAFAGNGRVEGVELADGEVLDADLVVIAAGIRPNAGVGRMAGLEVNRGILVDEYLRTSDPDIYAVGECTEFRGETFGLVAPLMDQGKVLAASICGVESEGFALKTQAVKLKLMGVDVYSAGETDEATEGVQCVRYEDPSFGVYKKLVLKENRLVGVVLVGDASDAHRYLDWMKNGTDLSGQRKNLFFPPDAGDQGLDVAKLPDSETICGCNGVTKGEIITAIHDKGLSTMAQLKEHTRASSGCGSCGGLCESLLKAVAPDFQEGKKVLCGCVPFSQEQLREIIRSQKIKSVQEVLDIYGNGEGCQVCKPALSYLVDVVWCGGHDEDRSARFINDRVHANIQNDGTFSVVPRMRGGITSPAELRKIADVAEKYNVPMVKVTGSQRLDLLGVKKEDLPKIWAELGMPSGQAYAKGVRMVKTCVGTDFCRFGTQNSIATGVELEQRLENLYTPHKFKMAVVGCPRNCAEATVKDVGLVGQEGSWQVVVGGAAGKGVRKADLLVTVETTPAALEAAELFFQYYRENANYLERSYDFVERLGIEAVRRETVYAIDAVKQGLLERLRKSKERSYDAWLERDRPADPTQFVQIQPMGEHMSEGVMA